MDNKVKSKWDFLLQSKPDIRSVVGNAKLIGGDINHNSNREKIFYFVTKRGTFTYNEVSGEFKSKVPIR